MRTLKEFLPWLLGGVALAFAFRRLAASATARPNPEGSSFDGIEAYIEREMRRLKLPGVSLAIVEGEAIVHLRGFGRARPRGEPPAPQTPFLIGSLTKSVTALAVMQLVEAGKIELEAPVQHYLPWFGVADPQASARMTVRHLLNQTSGIPESAGESDPARLADWSGAAERLARELASLRLKRPVGTGCEYSNTNYDLLGLIVEAASGESYPRYIERNIFLPLGMNHSYTSRTAARGDGLAMGHRYWFGIPIPSPSLPPLQGSLASGMLISSAEDLSRYLITHLSGGRYRDVRILSAAGIRELQRGAVEYRKMGVSAGRYAMGWFDGMLGRSRIVWHSGTVPDFGAYMAILPEQRKGVVLLFNACHWWYNPVQTEFGMGVAARLAGEEYSPTPFSIVVPWMLRAQMLIPAMQVADVLITLSQLRRWRRKPARRPSRVVRHVLLRLIPNLLVALSLKSVLGERRGYLRLYMPDFALIATVSGTFAVIWNVLRSALVLRAGRSLRQTPRSVGHEPSRPGRR